MNFKILKLRTKLSEVLLNGPWLPGDGMQVVRVTLLNGQQLVGVADNATWLPYIEGHSDIPFSESEISVIEVVNTPVNWEAYSQKLAELSRLGIIDPSISVPGSE